MPAPKNPLRGDAHPKGKKGLPKTGGITKGHLYKNTRELIGKFSMAIKQQEDARGESLLETAFRMIHDPATQDFVKKDLLLGLIGLQVPKMRAVEMDVEMPPTQILINTNLGPGNGDKSDQLPSIENVSGLPS